MDSKNHTISYVEAHGIPEMPILRNYEKFCDLRTQRPSHKKIKSSMLLLKSRISTMEKVATERKLVGRLREPSRLLRMLRVRVGRKRCRLPYG